MNTGLPKLVNPATRRGDIDLDATRADRERLHDRIRAEHFAYFVKKRVPGKYMVTVVPIDDATEDREQDPAA